MKVMASVSGDFCFRDRAWMRATMTQIMPPGIFEDWQREKFEFPEDAFDFLMKHMTPEQVMAHSFTSFSSLQIRRQLERDELSLTTL
jgi:hypothetical protein